MKTLEGFEKKLENLIGKPTVLRPFVCDGSPLECDVFIVGLNPATGMKSGFWDFWRPGIGFDKRAWLDIYSQERMASLTSSGNKKASTSNTRKRINWIMEEANSEGHCISFLETNIYAFPTKRKKDLKPEHKITDVFEFLVSEINPKIILVHGNDANEILTRLRVGGCKIIESKHLYNCSESISLEYGREIRNSLSKWCA